jgi:hypothetical protein
MPDANTQKIAELLETFRKLEASGAMKSGHPDHDRRNEVLDELQSVVGLEARMVMESDIIKRAEKRLAEGK